MTVDIWKLKCLELKLKWEFGNNNVQLTMTSKNYIVLVRNHFGVTSYVFPYSETNFDDVIETIQRDHIMVRDNY